MRLFIGLDLSIAEKLSLEQWRATALPELKARTKPVKAPKRGAKSSGEASQHAYATPTANYHVTLCFLGNVTNAQHETLLSTLDDVQGEPFEVMFDATSVWSGPKIFCTIPTSPPDRLMTLASNIQRCARQVGIQVEQRPYRPHITLARKADVTLPFPLFAPTLKMKVTHFHLFESVSSSNGVHYPIRHTWPLRYSMSVREQLSKGILE